MADARTDLFEFRNLVKSMRDAQNDYFSAVKLKTNTYEKLKIARKLEKQVDGVCTSILLDKKELEQSTLFEPVNYSLIVKKGLVDPRDLVKLYGKEVELEYLTKDGLQWLPTKGRVNAVTVRHAELERLRNLKVSEELAELIEEGGSHA
tara:strand:- start:8240 stop:8686 length:447 start_codon:yes stop_codon:yes gene_type:complete